MAATTIFRGLILAALAIFAADVATGVMAYFAPDLPGSVQSYLDEQNAGTLSNVFSEANLGTQIAVGLMMVLYLIAYLAALLGLLGFRRWARWVFIIVISLTLIFIVSGGTSLSTPVEDLVTTLGSMVDGAILTLLFIEPIRARFRATSEPVPSTPPEEEPPAF